MQKGGPADLALRDVASLESAEAGDVSLFSDAKYANAFAVTKASVVITSDKLAGLPHGVTLLVAPNPRLAFAQVGHIFYPPEKLEPGVRAAQPVHPTATIGEGSEIGAGRRDRRRREDRRQCPHRQQCGDRARRGDRR